MASPHEVYDEAIKLKDAGDLNGAIAKLQGIIEAHPDHADSHSALAVFLEKVGQADAAISHARRVCDINPSDPFSFTQLSVICVKCGRIQEAEDARAQAHAAQMGGESG